MVFWVKRLSWFWRGLIAFGILAIVLVCAFVVVQYATASSLGEVQPLEGSFVPSEQVVVGVSVPGAELSPEDVEFLVDAEPVPPESLEIVPGMVRATVPLRDGGHWARVTITSNNIFSRELVHSWEFTVDTVSPSVEVTAPEEVTAFGQPGTDVEFAFRESVDATLTVDGRDTGLPVENNRAVAELDLPEGHHVLAVTATDAAGNQGQKTWEAWADYTEPRVAITFAPKEPWKQTAGRLVFQAQDNLAEGLTATALLDGEPVDITVGDDTGAEGIRRYSVGTGVLTEGVHSVEFTVSDRGGHSFTKSERFLVDTTEIFGRRGMNPGARGRDVTQLQRILIQRDFLEGDPTGDFDEATADAVVAFKTERGLEPTPIVDADALSSLVGSITVDISERKLYHYQGGQLVKTYPVAVGQPRYPTPTGHYVILVKEYNPTWNPPPSPWAEGLEPVPPGPGNPLGTRWMGTSAPAIGIHGTYSSWSIGTAASHGCIRMYISDVEELFERVYVGTPVDIVR
jgi:hypothetical protein